MDQIEVDKSHAAVTTRTGRSVYVPPLQRTEGQPPPVAANGGLSYMSFDRGGDAGTAKAIEDALALAAEGEGERVIQMLDSAPPGPIETKWGFGFRNYDDCLAFIRANSIEAPEGGIVAPLAYTVYERPTYSVVRSNALWRDPARAADAHLLRRAEENIAARRCPVAEIHEHEFRRERGANLLIWWPAYPEYSSRGFLGQDTNA